MFQLLTSSTYTMSPTFGTSHFCCGISKDIYNKLQLSSVPPPALESSAAQAERCDNLSIPVKSAMVGKYTGLSYSYLSVLKALQHACIACSRKLVLECVTATDLEDRAKDETPEAYGSAWNTLKNTDGVLVLGGFGDQGVQGKILAATYARTNGAPYLGICLGMQLAIVDYARNVNPEMVENLEAAALCFVGKDKTGQRMEVLELRGHPYYVGVQFHPEFKSQPGKPSAIFLGLILAASGQMDGYINGRQSSTTAATVDSKKPALQV